MELERLFYDLDDLAVMLKTDRMGAWRAVYRYKIPHKRMGKRILILKEDFHNFLNNLPNGGDAPPRRKKQEKQA